MKIIGCGHPERGDDAVGLLVVQGLHDSGIEAVAVTGEAFELMEAWGTEDDVVVIDAVVTGAPCGKIQTWDDSSLVLPDKVSTSTHGLGLAEAIQLARALARLPMRLRIFGIEGREFSPGAKMSPEVKQAARGLTHGITREFFDKTATLMSPLKPVK
jgi:hydrogenase maturation protease